MSAIAELGLDASGFMTGIKNAKDALMGFQSAANDVQGANALPENNTKRAALTITAAVAAVIAIMTKGTQMAIQYGSSLVDMSYNVGLAADKAMTLQTAMERYGISGDKASEVASKFNAEVQDAAKGTGPLVDVLKNAGISMEDFAKMDVLSRMRAVAQAIKDIKHPTEQAQAAMAVWGAEGIKLNEALQPGNINSAAAQTKSAGELMLANAGIFARITQIFSQAGSTLAEIVAGAKARLTGFFTGMASELAPEILSILESISSGSASISDAIKEFAPSLAPLVDMINYLINLDFAEIGRNIGKSLATTIEQIRNLSFKDLMKDPMSIFKGREEAAQTAESYKAEYQQKYATPTEKLPEVAVTAPKSDATHYDISSTLSSLQKIGGGGFVGMAQDQTTMQTLQIQQDIRSYMKDLVDIVKKGQGNGNYDRQPEMGGMVLTA